MLSNARDRNARIRPQVDEGARSRGASPQRMKDSIAPMQERTAVLQGGSERIRGERAAESAVEDLRNRMDRHLKRNREVLSQELERVSREKHVPPRPPIEVSRATLRIKDQAARALRLET